MERERNHTADLQAIGKIAGKCPGWHSFDTPREGIDLDGCVPCGMQMDKLLLVKCIGKRRVLGVCADCFLGKNPLTDFVQALCQLEGNELDGVTKPLADARGEKPRMEVCTRQGQREKQPESLGAFCCERKHVTHLDCLRFRSRRRRLVVYSVCCGAGA